MPRSAQAKLPEDESETILYSPTPVYRLPFLAFVPLGSQFLSLIFHRSLVIDISDYFAKRRKMGYNSRYGHLGFIEDIFTALSFAVSS